MSDAASIDTVPTQSPEQTDSPAVSAPSTAKERRLRLWPAVVIVALLWMASTVPGWIVPGTITQFMFMFWGPMVAAAAFAGWWLFASRLPWKDRLLGLLAIAVVGGAAAVLFDPSFGFMAVIFFIIPAITTGMVGWLLVSSRLSWSVQRVGLLAVLVLTFGYISLLRLDGVDGNMSATISYRWEPTAEEKFLQEIADKKPATQATAGESATVLTAQPADWPGFRGADRDARRPGVRIATNWQQNPPKQVWRRRIGPGWSSFAVVGDRIYTQEQRGDDEAVICASADTGEEIWVNQYPARFTEVVAGPGPRATPTFHDGKIFALGGSGKLHCVDAATGKSHWSRDIVADSGAKTHPWGFASSPLVVDGVVSVYAGNPEGKSVLGYHASSGEPAWTAGNGKHSYCSTQLSKLAGVEQLLIATDIGLAAYAPATGEELWRYDWVLDGDMARIIQPTVVSDTDVLIGTGFGQGTRRVRVAHEGDKWTTSQVWETKAINPYFNDLVIHRGHVYGFNNSFFVCLDLENGKGKWKARGYGNGQVLLLPDQDLLLILSEKGEAALVEATPTGHKEISRFQALDGKTWNHPVVAHGKLYVRNGEEAACYELAADHSVAQASK